MARIPQVISQGTIASGQGPLAPLSLGSNEALTRLADTVTQGAGQILTKHIAARRKEEAAMAEAERTTLAMDSVFAGEEELAAKATELREGVGVESPRAARAQFREFMTTVVRKRIEEATKLDPRVGEFVGRHLGSAGLTQAAKFDSEMSTRFVEKQQFDVTQQVKRLKKQAIEADPSLNGTGQGPKDLLDKAALLIRANTGTAFSAEQGTAMLNETFDDVNFERTANLVRANREEYMTARATGGTLPDFIDSDLDEETLQKFDTIAKESITFLNSQEELERAEEKRIREESFDKTRLDHEAMIVQGDITELELTKKRNLFRPSDFHSLITLAHAREKAAKSGEDIKSDKVIATQIASDLNSPDIGTVRSITDSEIMDLVKREKLNWRDAKSFLDKKRERLESFRRDGLSLYDQTATKAEDIIKAEFRRGGLLDFDKQAHLAMNDALFEFRERWRARRGRGENPLDWVPEIIFRHEKPILDRNIADVQKRIDGFPLELRTREGVEKAWKDRKIRWTQYKNAVTMHDRLETWTTIQDSTLQNLKGNSGVAAGR